MKKSSFRGNYGSSLVKDCKKFWKSVKRFFTGKDCKITKIVLEQGTNVISDNVKLAQEQKSPSENVTESKKIVCW